MPELTNQEISILMFSSGFIFGLVTHVSIYLLGAGLGVILMMFILKD